jgi:hypothetical protein
MLTTTRRIALPLSALALINNVTPRRPYVVMRIVFTLILLGATCVSVPVAGQVNSAKNSAEPEKIGVLYYVDAATGSLTPLERQTAKVKGRYGKTAVISGDRSPVRLTSDTPEFVVRLASGVDPAKFVLYPFEGNKSQRELKMVGLLGGKTSSSSGLSCDVTQLGQSSYRIRPVAPLPAGEYGFSPNDSNDVFAFSIELGRN